MTHIDSGEGAAIICLIIFHVRQVIKQYCASQGKKKFLACLSFCLKDCCTYFSKMGIYLEIRTLLQRRTKISRSSTRFYFETRQNMRKYNSAQFLYSCPSREVAYGSPAPEKLFWWWCCVVFLPQGRAKVFNVCLVTLKCLYVLPLLFVCFIDLFAILGLRDAEFQRM